MQGHLARVLRLDLLESDPPVSFPDGALSFANRSDDLN